MEYFFVVVLGSILKPVAHVFLRFIFLPLYKLIVLSKLRLQRLALPARGFILFFVTNRYLFHAAVVTASLVAIWFNVQTKQVLAQDIGKRSILYSLMTEGTVEIVTEQKLVENVKPASANRFGPGTIEAVPYIDFNYHAMDEEEMGGLSGQIPGTLVLAPLDHRAEESSPAKPKRTEVENYTVQAGDTLGTIARDHSVNVGTILWANNLTERQYIRPGDNLKILPVSGVLAKVGKGETLSGIAKKYGGNVKEIIKQNNLADEKVTVGMELIIPGGEPPAVVPVRTVASTNYVLKEPGTTREVAPGENPVQKPNDAVEKPEAPKTRLLWPTSARIITQYYGWRHTGLDIAGDHTNPLYAADDGVVSISGWNSGGYGYQVLIEHPNGMKTRYAHASKLFVGVGDQVKRGQVIAMMGSTGRSTGPHIHFEVYVNGKRVNPLLYIR